MHGNIQATDKIIILHAAQYKASVCNCLRTSKTEMLSISAGWECGQDWATTAASEARWTDGRNPRMPSLGGACRIRRPLLLSMKMTQGAHE